MKSKQILGQRYSVNFELKTETSSRKIPLEKNYTCKYKQNRLQSLKLNPMNFHHSSSLLLVNLNDIILFHLESLGGLVIIDPSSIKQETEAGLWNSHPLAVRLLEFAHLCSLLHTEVNLVRILSNNLQLDVLSLISHLELVFSSLVEVNQAIKA